MRHTSHAQVSAYHVTAVSLTACVLLVTLWVRSYFWIDMAYGPLLQTGRFYITSIEAVIEIDFNMSPFAPYDFVPTVWGVESLDRRSNIRMHGVKAWNFLATANNLQVSLPHWSIILLCGMAPVLLWIRWSRRFSLRTLLIATTLVAVALGIVVAFT